MVWALVPDDPLSGEDKYYIFRKGTYNVGRKGCDVIIKIDKAVSRIHAEIIVDDMSVLDPLVSEVKLPHRIRIKDCSKYGTSITRSRGLQEKVHELKNRETELKDGDVILFGTGNAKYRFSFVPFVFFLYSIDSLQVKASLRDKAASIGARVVDHFSEECTHVLVDELTPVKEELFDAIISKKCVILQSWIEFLAAKSISSEFPSCSSYVPTLTLGGVTVKVVEPKARANCLEGYTCILDSQDKYKFEGKLHSLLQVCGTKILSTEDFCSSSQGFNQDEHNRTICIIPTGSSDKFNRFSNLSLFSRVNEVDVICAVLSGHLDSSILISPSVIISSSCSTDETIVADSDAETETATSDKCAVEEINVKSVESNEIFVEKAEMSTIHHSTITNNNPAPHAMDLDAGMTVRRQKQELADDGNTDVIYSENLIVRHTNFKTSNNLRSGELPNFKCFRKKHAQSGNSFNNLIPFSKYPYKGSEYENDDMRESLKEEKKRKQLEAVAEDLFNNEKGRRKGVAGSLRGLLTRR